MRDWSVDCALQVLPHEFFKWIKELLAPLPGNHEPHADDGREPRLPGFRPIPRTSRPDGAYSRCEYHDLLPDAESVGGPVDIHGWIAVRKSLGAYEVFRKTYREGVTPRAGSR